MGGEDASEFAKKLGQTSLATATQALIALKKPAVADRDAKPTEVRMICTSALVPAGRLGTASTNPRKMQKIIVSGSIRAYNLRTSATET